MVTDNSLLTFKYSSFENKTSATPDWELDFGVGPGMSLDVNNLDQMGQLAVLGSGDTVTLRADATQESRSPNLDVLILGGEPTLFLERLLEECHGLLQATERLCVLKIAECEIEFLPGTDSTIEVDAPQQRRQIVWQRVFTPAWCPTLYEHLYLPSDVVRQREVPG